MKEAIHQAHHQARHQGETINSIYLVLGVILILPLLWPVFGNEEIRKWHPFSEVEYSLAWYIVLTTYNLKPLLYLIAGRLAKPRHYTLIYVFMGYECILLLDHILIYSQSPGIFVSAILLSGWMAIYGYYAQ